jgi:signal transduction histidine kinase
MPLLPLLESPRLDPEQVFSSAVGRALVLGVVLGGGLAALLARAFAQRILRPIDALTDAARQLRAGQLEQRVPESGDAELVQLGQAFNRMAERLARTEQLRRTLVTDIAHELRTPLSNVRGYLEALEDGVVQPSPAVLACLREETALLARLVDDLQELSLAEAGKLALHLEQVAVPALLDSAAQALAAQAAARNLRLSISAAPELPPVLADPRRIGQVLRNLLANAITHTPPGGSITLAALPAPGGVTLAVSDTGSGIPADHLPHVFERFYRVDQSRARATGGAGLGLAIVRQFLRAHGSEVGIESQPGEGTTVRFTLAANPSDPREFEGGALVSPWAGGEDLVRQPEVVGGHARRQHQRP